MLRGFESLYPYMCIALPEDTGPRLEWITRVMYPADHGSKVAGSTIDMVAGADRTLAARRRTWHLGNGATTAVIMKRVWTASQWESDDDMDGGNTDGDD